MAGLPVKPIESPALLSARAITMDYPGVRALNSADFTLRAGEIHALLGENGAGKSTLVKIFSGLCSPTAGNVSLDGMSYAPAHARDAQAAGVSTVFQEIDVLPLMSVADNICLNRQNTQLGLFRRSHVRQRAKAALSRLDLNLDLSRSLGEFPIAIQQMVSIARALDIDARVLILDEPTSSLDAREADELFRVMRRLKTSGMGIIFISHFLEHVYGTCDRITVLRNGSTVGEWYAPDLSRQALIQAMTGRTITHALRAEHNGIVASTEPLLRVTALSRRRALEPTSIHVHAGESLGVAGLLGSGRTELARMIFGADTPDSGTITMNSTQMAPGDIPETISRGIAFTPEDRKAQGLILDLSVRENIVLAVQAQRGSLNPLSFDEQTALANHYISSMSIKTPSPETPVKSLSGGNQQKVLLARWLAIRPKVLILDEPTRGVDVGARAEIEALIEAQRQKGLAIIFISSEFEELVRTCSRVTVMRDKSAIAELSSDISESAILAVIAQGSQQ